jgi:Domain of unknown function (DUF4118)
MRKIITKRLPSFYIDVPALRPGTFGAYAFAFVRVAVATALRLALDPYLVGAQFITFFPAIVITTMISGFGAGFFCAVLSTAAADFFVLEPRWAFSFSVEDPANVADLLLFGPLASYCVIIIARMRVAWHPWAATDLPAHPSVPRGSEASCQGQPMGIRRIRAMPMLDRGSLLQLRYDKGARS